MNVSSINSIKSIKASKSINILQLLVNFNCAYINLKTLRPNNAEFARDEKSSCKQNTMYPSRC